MNDRSIGNSTHGFKALTSFFWTAEKTGELLRLVNSEHRSISEAARIIGGGCTKNMAVGKLDRMKRVRPRQRPNGGWRKRYEAKYERAAELWWRPELTLKEIARAVGVHPQTLVAHLGSRIPHDYHVPPTPNPFPERGCCLWGIGNPGEPGFRFCGSPNAPHSRNYCSRHADRARRHGPVEAL
jgi:GcrA cell cycle regulator